MKNKVVFWSVVVVLVGFLFGFDTVVIVAMFQLNVVLGIVISYFSNYLIGQSGEHSWRLIFGVQALPSLLFFILLRFVPGSPRLLILKKGRIAEATETLKIMSPAGYTDILAAIRSDVADTSLPQEKLSSTKNKLPIILAILFAVFSQVSGINAIIYYTPSIFEMTGMGEKSSLLSSVGIAFSQGAAIWVFISEIFPSQVRAKVQTLGSLKHWMLAALIASVFPALSETLGAGNTFMFFSIMMVLQLLFVWKMMPETKGRSFESLERTLVMR